MKTCTQYFLRFHISLAIASSAIWNFPQMHYKNPPIQSRRTSQTVTCVARKTVKEVEPGVKERLKKRRRRRRKRRKKEKENAWLQRPFSLMGHATRGELGSGAALGSKFVLYVWIMHSAQALYNHLVHHYPQSFCYDSIWHEISPRSRGTDGKNATDNTKYIPCRLI